MTKKEHDALAALTGEPWHTARLLKAYLATVEVVEEPKGTRTSAQNRAIHLDCKLIAEKLNDAGLDFKKTIRADIPWTPENVKEHLWKPIMKSLYGITSTRDLKKTSGQIDKVHEVLMRELGEKKGVEWHDFPSDGIRQMEELGGYKTRAGETPEGVAYPEMDESNAAGKF